MKRYNFYIITLFESEERLENVRQLETKLKKIGTVTIIPAYYYKTVDVFSIMNREQIEYTCKDRTLSLSQIGCFLSHREAWKKVANSANPEVHIIVEDDMDMNGDLYDFDIPEYDAVILWRHPSQMNTPVTYVKDGLLNFYKQWGMCSYSITPAFAKELLTIKEIDVPVDLLLYRDIYPNKKVYVTEKSSFINLGYLGIESNFKYKSWIY